jgi:hypothetical protein
MCEQILNQRPVTDPRWAETPRGRDARTETAQLLLHQQLDEKRIKYNHFIEFLQQKPVDIWSRLNAAKRGKLLEFGEKALAANALRVVHNQRYHFAIHLICPLYMKSNSPLPHFVTT